MQVHIPPANNSSLTTYLSLSSFVSSHVISITLITVHTLLGWDRPVHGKIAAMQLVKIKDTYEKVRDSLLLPLRPAWSDRYSISSVYDKFIPQVLGSLSNALMVESKDEGQLCICCVCVCVCVDVHARRRCLRARLQ